MHKNGRPTRSTQLQITKTLRPNFEKGHSASQTAKITGINIKTVCKYFDEWTEQALELESADFFERQKRERARIIISFDNLIGELYDLNDKVVNEIEQCKRDNKPLPKHLLSTRLEIIKVLGSLTEKKGSFAMQPTIDDALKKMVEETVKKYANAQPVSQK